MDAPAQPPVTVTLPPASTVRVLPPTARSAPVMATSPLLVMLAVPVTACAPSFVLVMAALAQAEMVRSLLTAGPSSLRSTTSTPGAERVSGS
jgi:hypothetical protein